MVHLDSRESVTVGRHFVESVCASAETRPDLYLQHPRQVLAQLEGRDLAAVLVPLRQPRHPDLRRHTIHTDAKMIHTKTLPTMAVGTLGIGALAGLTFKRRRARILGPWKTPADRG
jgi:hypothetical protein